MRDAAYAPVNSFPVRTRVGCAMKCVYCLAANLDRRHADDAVEVVLDEIADTVKSALARGVGSVPLFFADDEFNLPDERHPIAVLEGLLARDLARSISWRAYCNPSPFSDELAELVKRTNGRVSTTADSAADRVLGRAQKSFGRGHLDLLVETIARHDLKADMSFLFGLPGETEETLAETVDFVRSLPRRIDVFYSTGARVYPHTPLAAIAREQPEYLHGSDPSFFSPVVYSSPLPPRELARRLDAAFDGLPNVRRVGAGFARGRTTVAEAYRHCRDGEPRRNWRRLLAKAEERGDYQRGPGESLGSLMIVAIWHRRIDLAAWTARRMVRHGGGLPEGGSKRRLGFLAAILTLAGIVDRLRRALPRRGPAVRARGLEPPRELAPQRDLNPSRLPVPPRPRPPKDRAARPRPGVRTLSRPDVRGKKGRRWTQVVR